jgi:hypothetical protein
MYPANNKENLIENGVILFMSFDNSERGLKISQEFNRRNLPI